MDPAGTGGAASCSELAERLAEAERCGRWRVVVLWGECPTAAAWLCWLSWSFWLDGDHARAVRQWLIGQPKLQQGLEEVHRGQTGDRPKLAWLDRPNWRLQRDLDSTRSVWLSQCCITSQEVSGMGWKHRIHPLLLSP